MQRRILGRTGLEVSPIALGCAAFAYRQDSAGWDPFTPEGQRIVHSTIDASLDQGINYIDTAAAYGDGYSETLVGEVMRRRRSDCVLATKVWFEATHDEAIASVEASLRRLQTERVDILQIHGRMYDAAECDRIVNGGLLDALLLLREQGKVGHIGITAEEPYTLLPFLDNPDIELFQIAYNIIYQGAARHFLPKAAAVDAAVVTMRTMTSGVLSWQLDHLAPEWTAARDPYEVSLRFALADTRIHAGLVGMRWPSEVASNIALAEHWHPAVDLAGTPRLTKDIYAALDRSAAS